MTRVPHIVIVGGGVGGLALASSLGRSYRRSGAGEVTLIDRNLSHVWKPMLHGFAAGTDRGDGQRINFLAQARACDFRFWPGVLVGVDRTRHSIALVPDPAILLGASAPPGNTIDFDILVLAIGSRANDFGTPGLAEHCLAIDDIGGADLFRSQFRREIFSATLARRDLRIAIVGGGPTGVELAAELKRAVDLVSGYAVPSLRRRFRITLIQSGPVLLPTFPDFVSQGARKTLEALGIEVRTNAAVTGADAAGFMLKDGSRIDAELRIWAAGVKAPDVLSTIAGLERSRGGQLVVGSTLQTSQDPAIFALGDCAFVTDPSTGRAVPATAQAAHQQARYLARQLRRPNGVGRPPFRYRDFGSLVSLEGYGAWGAVGGHAFGGPSFRGWVARVGHDLLHRQHKFGLYGPVRGAADWFADEVDRAVRPSVRLD